MSDEPDVVIIGAGFGGLSAAYSAADRDASTIVLEEEPELNGEACAGGLPSIALEKMGIEPSPKFVINTINKIEIILPNDKSLKLNMKHLKGYVIDKTALTHILADRATKVGAEIRFNAEVTTYEQKSGAIVWKEKDTGKITKAKVIIDASGCNTKMARDQGLVEPLAKKDICLCSQYTVEHPNIDKDTMKMWVSQSLAPCGYIWSFPRGNGIARIGIGVCKHEHNPKKILDKFIDENFHGAKLSNYIGATIPLAPPLEHIVFDKVMLVGDRALMVLALTGAGNALAFHSGELAGDVAGRYIDGALQDLTFYEKTMKSQFYKKLWNSYKMKDKLYNRGDDYVYSLYRLVKPFMFLHRIAPKWVERKALLNARYG